MRFGLALDIDRPPVTVDDRPDADPLDWLAWIVTHHPYVAAAGQVVFVDGALMARLADGHPAGAEGSVLWCVQLQVAANRNLVALAPPSKMLAEVLPNGRRRWFKVPLPDEPPIEQTRLMWHGPVLLTLLAEMQEMMAA